MGNAVAAKWRNAYFYTKAECDSAIYQLDVEKSRVDSKIRSMQQIKSEYEINVIPFLNRATSKMEEEVEKAMKKAIDLLERNYTGEGAIRCKNDLNGNKDKILVIEKKINELRVLVTSRKKIIESEIKDYTNQLREIKMVKEAVIRQRNLLEI